MHLLDNANEDCPKYTNTFKDKILMTYMESLWELWNGSGIHGFVGDLGRELEKKLTSKNQFVRVGFSRVYDPRRTFILEWEYRTIFSGQIIIDDGKDNEIDLTIDKLYGLCPVIDETGQVEPFYPEELRMAVRIYENVGNFLDKKFGKPISECGGKSRYKTQLK
jgi:hypothetical protein